MPGSFNRPVDPSTADASAGIGIKILPAPSADSGAGPGPASTYVPFRPEQRSWQDGSSRFPLHGSRGIASSISIETPPTGWLTSVPVATSGIEAGPRRVAQRQSHTKSRNGCQSCKNRRIKCDESRPVCGHCVRRGFQCEWPDVQIREARLYARRDALSSEGIIQQPSPDAVFTTQDFRLFYHFINKAYPHQPMGNDSIWTHEIPSIAHDYDFLMHSMLALSAADLAERESKHSELTCSSISHRVKAIRLLNQALAKGVPSFEVGNAMLGTCYSLLFQSVFLEDGLPEFMTFLRGIVLVAFNMGMKGLKFLFHSMLGWEQIEMMDPHLQGSPGINPEPVNEAIRSLEAFEPLVQRPSEKLFHGLLMQTARHTHTSSKEAYKGIMALYEQFSWTMSNEDFQWFINPKNEVGLLLQCHFVAIQALLFPIMVNEQRARDREPPSNTTVHWVSGISKNIPPPLQHYVEWPLAMGAKVWAEEASQRARRNEESNCSRIFWGDGAGPEDVKGSGSVSELRSGIDPCP